MVGRHNAFKPEKHTFTSIHGIRFDLIQALGQELAENVATVIRRLNKLKLNEEETFLLMLLVVFSEGKFLKGGGVDTLGNYYFLPLVYAVGCLLRM